MAARSSRPVLAGVAAVAALTLSGCAGASPGVGVKVGDESLSTGEVDRLTVAYCDGLEDQLQSAGTAFPMSYVRGYVVRNLTVREAAEQLAEQYHVTLPPSYAQSLRDLRSQLSGFRADKVDEVLEVESVGAYVQAVEVQVGAIVLGDDGADDETKQLRGQDALEQWMAEHPADLNPKYGIKVSDTTLQAPNFVDTSTSYPLSADAVAAAKAEPDQEYAASLPPSQRCG